MALDIKILRRQFKEILDGISVEEIDDWLSENPEFDSGEELLDLDDFSHFGDLQWDNIQDTFDKKATREKIKRLEDRWGQSSQYHNLKDYYPNSIAERVLNKFIGKPFNNAFSKFCKLVPKYQQKYFLEEFNGRYADWETDENGCIVYNPRWKGRGRAVPKILSFDAEYGNVKVPLNGKAGTSWWQNHKYEFRLVNGEEFIFNNFGHEYQRCKEDQRKKKRAAGRAAEKKRQENFSTLLGRITKERRRKEFEENRIKIISHGFDPDTSFRPDRQPK